MGDIYELPDFPGKNQVLLAMFKSGGLVKFSAKVIKLIKFTDTISRRI